MMNKVLIYLDYGPSKRVVTDIDEFVSIIESDNRALISSLPYIINLDIAKRREVILKIARIWAKLTSSTRLAEATVSILEQYLHNIIDRRTLMLKVVREISNIEQIEDLIIMNILLKIGTGKSFPDIDLVALYEDPLSLEQGCRVGRIDVPGVLVRRQVRLEYESRLLKGLKKILLEFVLIRKRPRCHVKVIDWRCLGVYPYNGICRSIDIYSRELAEPVLCAYMRHGVDIVTEIPQHNPVSVIVVYYRFPRTVSENTDFVNYVEKFSPYFLCLPSSLSFKDFNMVASFLKDLGINILHIVDVPIDLVLELFRVCNS